MRKSVSHILLMLAAVASASPGLWAAMPDFGPNVIVFDPTISVTQIETMANAIAQQQLSNQFGPQRYALLFMPGTYGSPTNPLVFQVGYYTEVAGLGASPSDAVMNGKIDVHNQCFGRGNCNPLDNVWRSLSNLTINSMGDASSCYSSNEFTILSEPAVHDSGNQPNHQM